MCPQILDAKDSIDELTGFVHDLEAAWTFFSLYKPCITLSYPQILDAKDSIDELTGFVHDLEADKTSLQQQVLSQMYLLISFKCIYWSDKMYLLISSGKPTSPQNRQLDILINNSEQQVDVFVGGFTF